MMYIKKDTADDESNRMVMLGINKVQAANYSTIIAHGING